MKVEITQIHTLHCTVENLPPNGRITDNYIHCINFSMCNDLPLKVRNNKSWPPGCVAFRSHDNELELSLLKQSESSPSPPSPISQTRNSLWQNREQFKHIPSPLYEGRSSESKRLLTEMQSLIEENKRLLLSTDVGKAPSYDADIDKFRTGKRICSGIQES